MTETFESFIYRYGPADGQYTVVEVGATVDHWPTFVVRFGDKTAVLQLCGVGADSDNGDHHLSLDIHAFVDDQLARGRRVRHGERQAVRSVRRHRTRYLPRLAGGPGHQRPGRHADHTRHRRITSTSHDRPRHDRTQRVRQSGPSPAAGGYDGKAATAPSANSRTARPMPDPR